MNKSEIDNNSGIDYISVSNHLKHLLGAVSVTFDRVRSEVVSSAVTLATGTWEPVNMTFINKNSDHNQNKAGIKLLAV